MKPLFKNENIHTILIFTVLTWVVFLLDLVLPIENFGIRPRSMMGLIGIITAPFIHANLSHLLTNSLSLIIFGIIFALVVKRRTLAMMIFIILVQGVLTWILARNANHVGASGLIFGLFGYLLLLGYFQRKPKYVVLSLGMALFFGGLIYGVLPTDPQISWEGHLCGFFAGAIAAKYVRNGKNQKGKIARAVA
jgi:membrane associated rhomboid family serine protease